VFDLTGKKALVTGSTQGIGLAIAKCLSAQGATVYINGATSKKKVESVIKNVPNTLPALCDLSLPDCAERLYQITGPVDILILNASIQFRAPWDEITDTEFEKQLAVNFRASFKLIQKYAPFMIEKQWGRIVTVGSVQEKKPHKDMLIYAATKAAQTNMMTNLAKQFAPFGVTVNNVAPGVIKTPRNSGALSDEEYAEKTLSAVPCHYFAEPEDCAGQVLLLCSDAGRYITGESIYIDGGMKL